MADVTKAIAETREWLQSGRATATNGEAAAIQAVVDALDQRTATAVQMPAASLAAELDPATPVLRWSEARLLGDARAEEARREAEKESDKRAAIAYSNGIDKGWHDGLHEAGQRTAGGDAVPLFWLSSKQVKGAQLLAGRYLPFQREPGGNFDFPVFDREPVAEAAAQADDGRQVYWKSSTTGEQGYGAAPTAQPTPEDPNWMGKIPNRLADLAAAQNEENSLQTRMDAHSSPLLAAQPTPKENAPSLGRGACGAAGDTALAGHEAEVRRAHVATNAEAPSVSQPTPPDDERAAFEQHALDTGWSQSVIAEREGDGYSEPFLTDARLHYRAGYKEGVQRAALRQPGALPATLTSEEIADIASNYFAEGWAQGKAEAAICDALRALAAKQAGKEKLND